MNTVSYGLGVGPGASGSTINKIVLDGGKVVLVTPVIKTQLVTQTIKTVVVTPVIQ